MDLEALRLRVAHEVLQELGAPHAARQLAPLPEEGAALLVSAGPLTLVVVSARVGFGREVRGERNEAAFGIGSVCATFRYPANEVYIRASYFFLKKADNFFMPDVSTFFSSRTPRVSVAFFFFSSSSFRFFSARISSSSSSWPCFRE